MTVALYMDEHVHRAITTSLRLRGVDVLTTQDDGRRQIPDHVLLDRAAELRRKTMIFWLRQIIAREKEFLSPESCTLTNYRSPSVLASASWN